MRRHVVIFGLLFHVIISANGQKIVKGDIEYSIATYSEELFVDKKYGVFLDSLLKKPVLEYFRKTDIKNLPGEDHGKSNEKAPSKSHIIEPLFVNLSTFNGIYAKRIWPLDPAARRPLRFRCGFYHHLFIISDNKYVELSKDTVKNEKLIRSLFANDFSEAEISRMAEIFKYETICDHYTFLPSFYIKRNTTIQFDSREIKKKD